MLTSQMRKLRPERVCHLLKVTQQVNDITWVL